MCWGKQRVSARAVGSQSLRPSGHLAWFVGRNEWEVALLKGARAYEPQDLDLTLGSAYWPYCLSFLVCKMEKDPLTSLELRIRDLKGPQ